ncbi:CehA/McbA family metallohydrolase [Streptomyces sp. DSM 44915]|uniref:CehA/McbA family metallohydrolase n=1 Tax=Streptomyces chisholmiae TaxID=3075540 RepID=A0ABU2JYW8_9ACTN|nr:CehA/McbA family metallohydrolase [Streptomyces sp. DSM 44915]MDT0269719.1 CehA/McbA family metallohydrolase [Streptomyces sp. DSM 44915]
MTGTDTVHAGRWTLADRLDAPLRALPYPVPPGTAAITVELDYPRAAGVLDLGALGPAGYRGWSGGARDGYTIAADLATPGYLPGEPEPGEWQVLLRLHRVPPEGLPYRLRIRTTRTRPTPPPAPTAPPVPPRPPRRPLPYLDGLRWLAGDCHSHTVHSDGTLTPAELAALAAGRGLDFLAVTDHNTTSHHPELPSLAAHYGLTLLPGQEVTTDTGHANALGDIGWVDFRRPADDWVVHAARHGGLLVVNHPVAGDCAWRQPLTARPRHVEVWHSSWADRRWGAPLSWAAAWRPDTIALGGSDFHRPGADALPGRPTTWALAEHAGPDAVLAALAAGRVAVSAGPRAPLLLRHGDELLALDAEGTVLVRADGTRRLVPGPRARLPATPGPHRLETHQNEVLALCH